MSTLEKAIALAAAGHEGQADKAGAPYILHPLRVMLRVWTPEERMAAVLHDVVEDCGWTPDRLRLEGFPEAVVEAVDALSRRTGEDYEAFILRAAANPIARRVKLADLEDNCDPSRIAEPTEEDFGRLAKYRRAIAVIRRSFGAGPWPAPPLDTRFYEPRFLGVEGMECPIPACEGPGRQRCTGWVVFSKWGWVLESSCPEHGPGLTIIGSLKEQVAEAVRGRGFGGGVG